jgi:hypothetical protein
VGLDSGNISVNKYQWHQAAAADAAVVAVDVGSAVACQRLAL